MAVPARTGYLGHPRAESEGPKLRMVLSGDRRPEGPSAAPDGDAFSAEDLLLLSLFADGWCIAGIARRLEVSERTVRRRSRELCDRIGAHATIQVVAWAARRRLI